MSKQKVKIINSEGEIRVVQIYQNWRKPIFWLLILFFIILVVLIVNRYYFVETITGVKINLHEKGKTMEHPLKNEGVLCIYITGSDFLDSVEIDKAGQATFDNFPSQYIGKKAKFNLKAKYYQLENHDSVYIIRNKMNLQIKTKNLDRVWGYVFNKDDGMIEGVEVSLLDTTLLTGSDGKFYFYIPNNKSLGLTIMARKNGYCTYGGDAIFRATVNPSDLPNEGQPIGLVKIKK